MEPVKESSEFNNSEVIIVEYPRSGFHWLTGLAYMSAGAGGGRWTGSRTTYHDIFGDLKAKTNNRILRLGWSFNDLLNLEEGKRWRTWEELETDKSRYRNKKVVLLIRDPKDIIVSHFWMCKKRAMTNIGGLYKEDIEDFYRGAWTGVKRILTYWNIWDENRYIPQEFHIFRYEDLHTNATNEIRRLFAVLNFSEYSDSAIEKAVEKMQFDKQRSIEDSGWPPWADLKYNGSQQDSSTHTHRVGKIGDYKNHLNAKQIKEVDEIIKQVDCRLLEDYYI